MPNLTRIPLAAVVCPSAPFLAPRLLRATIPIAVNTQRSISSTPRCCNNAAKGKKSGRSYFLEMRKREQQQARRRERRDDVSHVSPQVLELALAVQQACEKRDLQQLRDLYPAALDAGLIDGRVTHIICQALHASVRRDVSRKAPSQLSNLLPFAGQIVADLQKGSLPPHHFAYVHLLGIYKDSKHFADGHALWQWLTKQDDTHVSQAAYGAAIELLSYANLMSLAELEDLYDEGLKRFPGTFAEYHLLPDAIVPDRTQPVHIIGLPTTLLQGIITARLRSHDWRNAYLGLDTILRLYPGQTPPRIFQLFINERPLHEAYTACLLACRSGVQISGAQVTTLLNRLRVAMTQAPLLHDRFNILRAIANALYAYQQCGGGLASVHVGQFIKAFEFLLPDKAPGQHFTKEEDLFRNTIAFTAHECVAGLVQSGMSIGVEPFVSLVSLAGKLREPELLKQTLEDARTAGVTFQEVERRNLLTAAGLVQDQDLVKAIWSLTVSAAADQGTPLSYNDWITLAKACRRTDLVQYFEQQLQEQAHSITASIESRARAAIANPENGASKTSPLSMTPEQIQSEIQTLQAQMKNIQAVLMSGQPLDMQNSPFYMHIDPSQPPLAHPSDLRTIYDELTTDPHQPAASPSSALPPALSKTGIPLDTLRFLNWTNVHEMMAAASAHAASRHTIIDQAIALRKSPKDMPEILFLPHTATAPSAAALRTTIRKLRSTFRLVDSKVPPETPKLATDPVEMKIRKHDVKPFTVRKVHSEASGEVAPESRDVSEGKQRQSRWVPNSNRIHSETP